MQRQHAVMAANGRRPPSSAVKIVHPYCCNANDWLPASGGERAVFLSELPGREGSRVRFRGGGSAGSGQGAVHRDSGDERPAGWLRWTVNGAGDGPSR